MALGRRKDGGNFLPIAKFDAGVGKFLMPDRVLTDDGWRTVQRDITGQFEAIFDLKNIHRVWIEFLKGAALELVLVSAGEDPGEAPSDEHKEGVRLTIKMADALGGEVRELLSTARGALDDLHDKYLANVKSHPGHLPIVKLARVKEIKTGTTATFVPVFEILGWMLPRPELQAPETMSKANGRTSRGPDELDETNPF